jgi:hypothetical protein
MCQPALVCNAGGAPCDWGVVQGAGEFVFIYSRSVLIYISCEVDKSHRRAFGAL